MCLRRFLFFLRERRRGRSIPLRGLNRSRCLSSVHLQIPRLPLCLRCCRQSLCSRAVWLLSLVVADTFVLCKCCIVEYFRLRLLCRFVRRFALDCSDCSNQP